MSHSLYVHIPICIQKCTYCDFFSDVRYLNSVDKIIDSLIKELRIKAASSAVSAWNTIYIGGGTPSVLTNSQVRLLCSAIRSVAPVVAGAEWTIEANPEDITAEWLDGCAIEGINRLSFGLQSMNDEELSLVRRRGNRSTNLKALDTVNGHWPGEVSLDLISGLPGQTKESLAESISWACASKANHISLYSLTIEDGTALAHSLRSGTGPAVPRDDEADSLWLAGRDALIRAGFAQYEVSNFARTGHESAHNLVYWRMGEWIGVGPSASGTVRRGPCALRTTNAREIEAWLADPVGSAETEEIGPADCAKETLIMGMRLLEGVDRRNFANRFGRDILEVAGKTCAAWERRGLLRVSESRIALNAEGILLLNAFLGQCLEEMD